MRTTAAILALSCLVIACNQASAPTAASDVYNIPQQVYQPVIESFLPEMKSKLSQQFSIEAGKEISVKTREGSEIIIPANCFVYEDGSPVKDKVDISFSQYDSPLEIIASGIPMTMDVNGERKAFESAGMFEISGKCKDKAVAVCAGKNITVKLRTEYKDTNYNFYQYNTTENKWVTLENADKLAARTSIEKKVPATNTIDPEKPVAIEAHKAGTPVFELDVNSRTLRGMESFDNILWTYAGAGSDPFKSPGFFKTKWTSTTITRSAKKENAYDVVCEKDNKKFSTCVKPVLFGSQLKRAQQAYEGLIAEYNARVEAVKNANKWQTSTNMATRMLAVSSFGIYNCDRIGPNGIRVAGFRAHIQGEKKISTHRYYLVTPSANASIYLHDAQNFTYNPAEENYILALMEDNKVAVAMPEQVNKLNKDETGDLSFRVSQKTLADNIDFISLLSF